MHAGGTGFSARCGRFEAQWGGIKPEEARQAMGFADVSVRALAEDRRLSVEELQALLHRLGIPFRDADSELALEDVKCVILALQDRSEVESR
jgi:hypothetical protein